ncbi:helicase-associated domain-containing protein [Leifsonia sp. NPDC058292]|uniref:helicase-associated domain-containing protein n=1 Tax=Leifsonia sp. NPDC058292 TaxID=3346428 RepID=UPI0036DD7FA5
MTNTLALAERLRELTDDALGAALAERSYRRAGITDFFDLADALLDGDSVQKALSALDRPTLAVLVTLGAASGALNAEAIASKLVDAPATDGCTTEDAAAALQTLARALLVHPEPASTDASDAGVTAAAVYESVTAQLATWPSLGLPSPTSIVDAPSPPALAPVPDTERRFTDRLASERAFESVAAVSELLAELDREGARELQKGGLALPASKRIAGALAVDVSVVPTVVSVASRAGLVALDDALWLPTEESAGWSHSPTADRWKALVAAWQNALPDDLRALLTGRARAEWGESLREHVAWLYPAGREIAQKRVVAYTRDAEWLGITARQAPSSAGTALVEQGPDAAAQVIRELFPAEVDKVYLQHDLTVVSPGPLEPGIDARLRVMADVEGRALASTFRVSAASINRAIAAGETAESIREFLASISLTGLPQPLDYLITDATERYGRVRVCEITQTDSLTRSAVVSADPQLLRTIEVDQSLNSLSLARVSPERLESRYARDVVFWALSDARYPVAAEDAAGEVVSLRRHRVARPQPTRKADPAADLIARLRETEVSEDASTQEQWLARQLDLAIRGKQTVVVQVAMPDGRTVEYLLEPTGVGGGRLRGRDRAADIERTLPLSSVVGLRPSDE